MPSGNAYIGKLAPDLKAAAVMADGQFKDIKHSDNKGKYMVLFFCLLAFIFICPTEIFTFMSGAFVHSHFCHLACVNTPKKQGVVTCRLPSVSDTKHATSVHQLSVHSADS
uniref:thioredoxin-dependent peroxiredoxin n=1 Tax=Salvator merianae TaxID=96440 RepID=A0A8D0CDN2_SALMN